MVIKEKLSVIYEQLLTDELTLCVLSYKKAKYYEEGITSVVISLITY